MVHNKNIFADVASSNTSKKIMFDKSNPIISGGGTSDDGIISKCKSYFNYENMKNRYITSFGVTFVISFVILFLIRPRFIYKDSECNYALIVIISFFCACCALFVQTKI